MKPDPVPVELSEAEFWLGQIEGERRQRESVMGRREPKWGQTNSAAAIDHVLGARGEFAVAKLFNLYPTGIANRGAPDVGGYIEVRAVRDSNRRLLLHDDDKDHLPVVLAQYVSGRRFQLAGWCKTRDGKRSEWFKPLNGDNRPCYVVPHDALRSIEELRRMEPLDAVE